MICGIVVVSKACTHSLLGHCVLPVKLASLLQNIALKSKLFSQYFAKVTSRNVSRFIGV
jgi:hypothetical protein